MVMKQYQRAGGPSDGVPPGSVSSHFKVGMVLFLLELFISSNFFEFAGENYKRYVSIDNKISKGSGLRCLGAGGALKKCTYFKMVRILSFCATENLKFLLRRLNGFVGR